MSEEKHRDNYVEAGSFIGVIWYVELWLTIGITNLSFW